MSVFTVFRHRTDVYAKVTTTTEAGQRRAEWIPRDLGVKCHYIPRVSIIRTAPTFEETEVITMFFPADSNLDYGCRLYNTVDRYGNDVEPYPMEIDSILRQPGFSGKIHHIVVKAKRVRES